MTEGASTTINQRTVSGRQQQTESLVTDEARKTNTPMPLEEDTVGPYYPHPFVNDDRHDLTQLHPGLSVGPHGNAITLRISLLDSEGAFVPDALVEFWQSNADGVFRTPAAVATATLDPHFDGFGRLMTANQPFEIRTIKPGRVVGMTGMSPRAPHITLTIFSDGISRLVTQIFFDDTTNADDPLLNSLPPGLRERLVARRMPGDGDGTIYELSIVMRGESETPFFDDILS